MVQSVDVSKTETHTSSNDELLAFLRASMAEERRRIADIISGLIEVEERQLHRALACTSMFHFCVHKLGMSESEAFRRLTAARLAKHFPPLLAAIGEGRIHLSTVVLLRDLFTESNVAELIATVSGMSKREVEALIARRSPKPDVASSIRKLPGALSAATPSPTAGTVAQSELPEPITAESRVSNFEPAFAAVASSATVDGALPPPRSSPKTLPTGVQMTQLSDERHRVQFTASTDLRAKLERAQSLLRHSNIDGDLAVVVERAVDLLIAKLERRKFGAAVVPRPTKPHAPTTQDSPEAADTTRVAAAPHHENGQANDVSEAPVSSQSMKRRKVPRSTLREVIERDGEKCSFVGTDGTICGAVDFLEVDHIHPHAKGGGNDASNLRLLCRAHNQYAAEQTFGRDFVARKRRERKSRERKSRVASRGRAAASPTQDASA